VQQIERDLEQLAACFVDFNQELTRQGEDIQQVQSNVNQAMTEVELGTKEVQQVRFCFMYKS
jgi:hypothetical protein